MDKPTLNDRHTRREKVWDLESALSRLPDAKFGDSELAPLYHLFCKGMYIRQIFLPKGLLATGMIHKHEHPSFILTGDVGVFTEEEGLVRFVAPKVFVSKPGTKRAVFAFEDTIWVTVHLNPEELRDPDDLREYNVTNDYAQLEEKELLCLLRQ